MGSEMDFFDEYDTTMRGGSPGPGMGMEMEMEEMEMDDGRRAAHGHHDKHQQGLDDADAWGELEDEADMYVGVGTKAKRGFMARGGAGGPPVWRDD